MNLKRAFIALGAMLLGVGFFGASPAMAVTQGGVTCTQVTGGTYPKNGHVYQCTSSTAYNNEIRDRPYNIMQGTWGPNILSKFSAAPVDFYAFEDAIAAESFLQNVVPTEAQRQQFFAKWQGAGGFSSDPATTTNRRVVVFKNIGVTNNYPTTVSQNMTDFSHTIVHEMGHNFDFLSKSLVGGTLYPSATTEFDRVVNIDDAWLKTQTSGNPPPNDYATIKDTYKYWLAKDSVKVWSELFAEEFAKLIHGTAGTNPAAGADGVIQTYYTCSLRYVQFIVLNNRPPVKGTTDYNTARCR